MSSTGVKRSSPEEDDAENLESKLATTIVQADDSSAAPLHFVRDESPLSSVASSVSRPLDSTPLSSSHATPNAPAGKRRKLTPAEKEAAKADKEQKELEKTIARAKKEQEKQLKLEEKKQKDEEKEEKRRLKETEKAVKDLERKEKQDKKDADRKAKEDEKAAIEEAKAKKERSQMRLTGFFSKPKDVPTPSLSTGGEVSSGADTPNTTTLDKVVEQPEVAGGLHHSYFLAFEPPSHSTVAPFNRYLRDLPALDFSRRTLDTCFAAECSGEASTNFNKRKALADAFELPVKRRRYIGTAPVNRIIAAMSGTKDEPIDLTDTQPVVDLTLSSSPARKSLPCGHRKVKIRKTPEEQLKEVPVKYIQFREDIRPPYIGTWTKDPEGVSIKALSRKPWRRALPKVNYDYDSEAEWEPPEEGDEEIGSEGEEEADDDDGDDLEGFLDDEEMEDQAGRRQILGELIPKFTPVHWQTGKRTKISDIVPFGEEHVPMEKREKLDLKQYGIQTFLEGDIVSIDPFSAAYWGTPVTNTTASGIGSTASMGPPRLPLHPSPAAVNLNMTPFSIADGSSKTVGSAGNAKMQRGRPASKPFPEEELDSFKAAIVGSDLTKIGLVEVLKKRFPHISKNTVQETLERVAHRVGEKAMEKKWALKLEP